MLGGVRIDHDRGLVAHSDGDVLLHALTDAILGAAGLGDIGQHFPDTEAQWAGADSGKLLQQAWAAVQAQGWTLANADLTVMGERPKVNPHRQSIVSSVAALLAVSPAQINLKATTTEKLGFLGRKEGLAAMACVLLYATDPKSVSPA
jgi:2-C-methyl-D-erythritol 2,4-cyclodiphosphate synthase